MKLRTKSTDENEFGTDEWQEFDVDDFVPELRAFFESEFEPTAVERGGRRWERVE